MKKLKFKKKTIIISIIIILIAIFVLSNVFSSKESDVPDFETALVEKKTLTTTISSTGKIATENSKNVTSQLMNYKVTGVNVKVGDKVNEGDVLCTFDTADLAKTVADLSATINAANTTSGVTVASAERAVQDIQRTRDNTLDELNKTVQNTRQDYDNHNAALNTAKSNLQTKQTEVKNLENQVPTLTASVNAAQTAKNEAQNVYTQKETEYTNAKTALETADPSQLEILGSLQAALVGATQAKENAKAELTVKENTLATEQAKLSEVTGKINTLNAEITQLNQTIPGQEATVNAKREVLSAAEKAYNDQASTLNNQVANAQGQLDSAKAQTSVGTLTTEEQLNVYQKQLAETNLKAPAAGTVTAVNVKAGDYYTGGALVTIEGIESFIVETEIDEYDIADVTVGMEAIIKTDSTRDEELIGEVISVAPAATGSSASSASAMSGLSSAGMGSSLSSGGSATYTVKIVINTPNDRLRLGMNAKLNIITQKSTDVLAVPYDAINEREDGTKFVTIIHGENVEEDIDVTTGLESGYYTEISSDKIQEGETVKIPKVDSTTSVDELLNSMGATGGM